MIETIYFWQLFSTAMSMAMSMAVAMGMAGVNFREKKKKKDLSKRRGSTLVDVSIDV